MKTKRFQKNKLHLAFISTINSVNDISALGDFDYCLAPYIKKSAFYFNYFKWRIEKGFHVILDDTIAEDGGKLKFDELVTIAIRLNVTEIVIPDKIGNYEQTKQMRETFLDMFYPILKKNKIKILAVIQGQTLTEYLTSLEEIEDDNRIDTIGIPFRMNYAEYKGMTKEENQMHNRVHFVRMFPMSKPIHLLGCNLVEELELLKGINIRSCDSKLMARYGKALKIYDINDKTKPSIKLNMEDDLDKKQIEYAIKNIEKIKNG